MPIRRLIASGSATEVPPNFMTTLTVNLDGRMGRVSRVAPDSQESVPVHQLSIQNRDTCRAANGVVAERDELVVEDRTRTQPPDGDSHAAATVDIERRLGTVALAQVHDRLRRRRGKAVERLRRHPRVDEILFRRSVIAP